MAVRASGNEVQLAQRRAQAFDLKVAGLSCRQVAERLGVSVQTAHADVRSVGDRFALLAPRHLSAGF